MTHHLVVDLPASASDMAQEEIRKQVGFLAKGISNVRFRDDRRLECDAPPEANGELSTEIKALARRIQTGLRSLQRKVAYRSSNIETAIFLGTGMTHGIRPMGKGQFVLEGLPARLYAYFDRLFVEFATSWRAAPVQTPTLISPEILARCDYFRSFPHAVTFACHLCEEVKLIEEFCKRHHDHDALDWHDLADMDPPEACLTPALCYHTYYMNENRMIPSRGLTYTVRGKCFRYESNNLQDLRRLWDFTMREVVFLGTREDVLRERQRGIEIVAQFLEDHDLAGEIRTASDPFFIAPESIAKTYFQLSSETKYEISLLLPDDERLAVGSLNYHSDFFGKTFNVTVEGAGLMHSACIGFGLERCIYAFLAQHGDNPATWPDIVRRAPELADASA